MCVATLWVNRRFVLCVTPTSCLSTTTSNFRPRFYVLHQPQGSHTVYNTLRNRPERTHHLPQRAARCPDHVPTCQRRRRARCLIDCIRDEAHYGRCRRRFRRRDRHRAQSHRECHPHPHNLPTTDQQRLRRVCQSSSSSIVQNNASTRVKDATGVNKSCERVGVVAMECRDMDDVDTHLGSIPPPCTASKCTQIMTSTTQPEETQILAQLVKEPGAVWLCESAAGHIVLTPAEEGWPDFTNRCSNQPNPQWAPYLGVPPVNYAYSPFGPTNPVEEERPEPITVFSPARFAAFIAALVLQTPKQAVSTQQAMFKAVAYDACLAGASVREYYDHPVILERLNGLYTYVWDDPAAHLLESWRHCFLVTIHESDHPSAGVPHIVVSHCLPNAPWDCDAVQVPEQDHDMLALPIWVYQQKVEEQEPVEDQEPQQCDEEQEQAQAEAEVMESESTSESEEARTPSPPSWDNAGRAQLETLLEEEEEEQDNSVPSVRQVRSRQAWLEDDDDDFIPPVPVTRCVRIVLRCSLPTIDERPEPAYRPFSVGTKPLWSSRSWSPAQYIEELEEEEDEAQVYDDDEEAEEEESVEEYGFGFGYRPQDVPRPSCDIFINEEDSPQPSPISPASQDLPLGKANVSTGWVDWFDLPEDDLGPLDWATTG
ncbi:hypothetical protein C8F01DRAFT_613874 [Mycena amicta]|nr:hypothetical protein C8F01DRAFT_613874 [Mycena amicta]